MKLPELVLNSCPFLLKWKLSLFLSINDTSNYTLDSIPSLPSWRFCTITNYFLPMHLPSIPFYWLFHCSICLFFIFLLKYSWFTMLVSGVQHSDIDHNTFKAFIKYWLYSLCCTLPPVSYLFIHSSLYLLIPYPYLVSPHC